MTKLPLLLALIPPLCSLPGNAQIPAATVASTPTSSHGVPLSLVQDAAHGVNAISRIRNTIRRRYVQVFLGVHNTGAASSVEFNPGAITLIAAGDGYFLPMDASEIRDMARDTSRHQILGAIGIASQPQFGDPSGDSPAGANGQNLQAYRQTADDWYDASVEDDADNPANFSRTNLTRATIGPGEKLEGFLYFDLGKKSADSGNYKGYKLRIPLGDQVYEMDFTATAKAAVLPPPHPASAQLAQPSAAAPVPKPAPTGNSALQVISEPDEADVALDGKFIGQTPLLIPLAPGDHTLRLTKNGFVTWEQKVHATGVRVTVDAELKAQMVIRVR